MAKSLQVHLSKIQLGPLVPQANACSKQFKCLLGILRNAESTSPALLAISITCQIIGWSPWQRSNNGSTLNATANLVVSRENLLCFYSSHSVLELE